MYNFAALNRWGRFRVWLGHRHGIVSGNVSETLRRCNAGLGTHISPNHLLERGYPQLSIFGYVCLIMQQLNKTHHKNVSKQMVWKHAHECD